MDDYCTDRVRVALGGEMLVHDLDGDGVWLEYSTGELRFYLEILPGPAYLGIPLFTVGVQEMVGLLNASF